MNTAGDPFDRDCGGAAPKVEFVEFGEIWNELARRGIVETRRSDVGVELSVDAAKRAAVLELGSDSAPAGPGAIETPIDRIAATLEAILHKLHLTPVYLIPIGRWRDVFEVVSFGLAKNTHWQEIESQASVELNTRDALQCELRDLHTLRELLRTLLVDGASDDAGVQQGLALVATGQLMVANIVPHRRVRLEFGSASVSEHVRDAANHFLGRASAAP